MLFNQRLSIAYAPGKLSSKIETNDVSVVVAYMQRCFMTTMGLHVHRPSRVKTIIFVNINMVLKVTGDIDSSVWIESVGWQRHLPALWLNVFDCTPLGWRNWNKGSKK